MIYLAIVDEHGQPVKADLADLLVEAIVPLVGFFKTASAIETAIRTGISDLLRERDVTVIPDHYRICPSCALEVSIWHTFTNGSVLCHACSLKPHE